MNDPAEWEAIHQSRMWGTYPDIHVVRQVKSFMVEWEYSNKRTDFGTSPVALDIGCGVGACSFMMDDEGMWTTAVDGSACAIERMSVTAKKRNGLDLKMMVADAQSVEFPAESFDFILDNFTLTNIEHPPWERILSWLKPNGWLVHASFSVGPKDSPQTWHHTSPGDEVERHEIWNDHGTHAFTVRRYIKPN